MCLPTFHSRTFSLVDTGLIPSYGYREWCCRSIDVSSASHFPLFGYILQGKFAGSSDKSMPGLHTVFHSDCTNLHSHQQLLHVCPLTPKLCLLANMFVFLMLIMLTVVNWNLGLVWIHFSLWLRTLNICPPGNSMTVGDSMTVGEEKSTKQQPWHFNQNKTFSSTLLYSVKDTRFEVSPLYLQLHLPLWTPRSSLFWMLLVCFNFQEHSCCVSV